MVSFSIFEMLRLNCRGFLDAMYVARDKALRNPTLAGVICFQLQESEFSRFIIQELAEEPEESENPLEWRSFVKMCRLRFINYPHMFRKDGFSGPICNNAEKSSSDGIRTTTNKNSE